MRTPALETRIRELIEKAEQQGIDILSWLEQQGPYTELHKAKNRFETAEKRQAGRVD